MGACSTTGADARWLGPPARGLCAYGLGDEEASHPAWFPQGRGTGSDTGCTPPRPGGHVHPARGFAACSAGVCVGDPAEERHGPPLEMLWGPEGSTHTATPTPTPGRDPTWLGL